jgi:hypothetical protein
MGCFEPQNSQRCIIVPPGTEYAALQKNIALVVSRIHYITPSVVYQIYSNFSIIVTWLSILSDTGGEAEKWGKIAQKRPFSLSWWGIPIAFGA